MKKNISLLILLSITTIFLTSCQGVYGFEDAFKHFSNMKKTTIKKHPKNSKKLSDIKFNIANNPDYRVKVNNFNLNSQYQQILNFLKKEHYSIEYKQKTENVFAQVVAIPPNKNYYIGVGLSLNPIEQKTIYNVVYAKNSHLAKQFFNNFKKYNKN